MVPNSERCNVPAAAICASQDSVIIVDINAPSANVVFHKWQPNTPDGHGTPFLFQHGRAAANSTGGAFMRMFKGHSGSNVEDWQFSQALAFSASGITSSSVVAITSDKDIITGRCILVFLLSTLFYDFSVLCYQHLRKFHSKVILLPRLYKGLSHHRVFLKKFF